MTIFRDGNALPDLPLAPYKECHRSMQKSVAANTTFLSHGTILTQAFRICSFF